MTHTRTGPDSAQKYKCKPGCAPAAPCYTAVVCPIYREGGSVSRLPSKVRPDLPAARPTRFLPLRHEGNGGFAIWGRR
jgi:hypothetical protein